MLEAMASGIPVVQPSHGAFPELIKLSGAGLLCQPNDPSDLADKLHSLLSDQALQRQLSEAGVNAAKRHFTTEEMARNNAAVFYQYLNQKVSMQNHTTQRTDMKSDVQLVLDNVTKTYQGPQDVTVLKGISLALQGGEAMAITGPSGSGKSTLLHLLGTLDMPSSGSVQINGKNVEGMNELSLAKFRNQVIGFVFQDHHLMPQYSVLQNVLLPTKAFRRQSEGDLERAEGLLEKVGLSHRLQHTPAEVSGGERQRVAIARALINRPSLLLCDEPTGNLDQDTARAVTEVLFDLHQSEQNILIVVTHNPELAALFPRQISLQKGLSVPV